MCGDNSLVRVWYVGVWENFGLYRVCVSFTLCWLSLYGGLPGFKGFIGKVVYSPFLLWGALVLILLGI